MTVRFELPWPPTVNKAYGFAGGKKYKTSKAKKYCSDGGWIIKSKRINPFGEKRLKVIIKCFPPDRVKRDLDNLGKVLLDTLEGSGIFDDDEQIDDLRFIREKVLYPGHVEISIQEI